MKRALIIGGGPAGCAAAHQLIMARNWDITLVDKAPFLGAGARTFFHGGHPYTFGPRHFLTQNENIYEYLNELLPLRRCNEHEFWSYVEQDGNFYNFPIHADDVNRMPDKEKIIGELYDCTTTKPLNLEDYWIKSVGPTLYNKFINKYSKKMWRMKTADIDTFNWSPKGVALKSGARAAWDTAISAYPLAKDGYNSWFNLCTQGVKVYLSTEISVYDFKNKVVWFGTERYDYDIIISTISPDIPFSYMHGILPYMGRDFHKIVLPVVFALPPDVYWIYEAGDEKWTRTTEFKKLTQYRSEQSLLGVEIPSSNGKYYPYPVKQHQQIAERYYKEMSQGVFCLGRSGCYRYGIDISSCIEQAMELMDILKQGGQDHPVVGAKWRTI